MKVKAMLLLAMLLAVPMLQAQDLETSQAISVGKAICSQGNYLLWCSGVPVTVNGVPGTVNLTLYTNGTGIVVIPINGTTYYAGITYVTVVSAGVYGPTEIKRGFALTADPEVDAESDSVSGMLDLNITYIKQASGGGRGSHNYIIRPEITSGTGSLVIW